jgi:MFS family permease
MTPESSATGTVAALELSRSCDETSARYPGWRVLFASFIGLAFSPGPMIFGSFGLFAPHLHRSFGWSLGRIMLALTLFNVAGVLASPYTGRLIDRFGVRVVLFPALLAFAAGFLGLAYSVASLSQFYLLAFLWGAFTVGTQSISYTKLLTVWFERRRGLAVGIAAAGLGLGYSIVPLLIAKLLGQMDWHAALAVMALVIALVPTGLNALFAHPRPKVPGMQSLLPAGLSLQQARHTPEFWYMSGAIFLASTALTGVVPHLALMTLDRGFTAPQAALVAATYGISTIVGRVLVGALADRYFVPRVAMLFFAISTLGFLWAALIGVHASLAVLALIALTIGLGFGAESDVIALFISRYFGQRSFGAIYGALLAVFLIGASAGPPLFGFGRDRLGSYAPLMLAAAAVMIGAVLLLARLAPPRLQPDSASSAVAFTRSRK